MIEVDASGKVTILDGLDDNRVQITGWQNLLLQLAIDRAAKNTVQVEVQQVRMQLEADKLYYANDLFERFLAKQPTDPGKNQGATIAMSFTSKDKDILKELPEPSPPGVEPTLDTYFVNLSSNPLTLKDGKSFNDVMTAMKSGVNRLTNQNQQDMISYQSMLNQRNQMTEWVANLMTEIATQTAQVIANLR
jgi:hypothetical protein